MTVILLSCAHPILAALARVILYVVLYDMACHGLTSACKRYGKHAVIIGVWRDISLSEADASWVVSSWEAGD